MSTELERFVAGLGKDKALVEGLASAAKDVEAVVSYANGKGYSITADDVNALTRALRTQLSDEDLEKAAGGIGIFEPGKPGADRVLGLDLETPISVGMARELARDALTALALLAVDRIDWGSPDNPHQGAMEALAKSDPPLGELDKLHKK